MLGQFTTEEGNRLWDFVLPGDNTVAQLARDSVARGFELANIRVIRGSEDRSGAVPVTVEILELWSWNLVTWTNEFRFRSRIRIRGDIGPFRDGKIVQSNLTLRSILGGHPNAYRNVVTQGMEQFVENLADEARKAN